MDLRFQILWLSIILSNQAFGRIDISIRPIFALNQLTLRCYEFVNFFVIALVGLYMYHPFFHADTADALFAWRSVYFYGHVFSITICLLLPAKQPHAWTLQTLLTLPKWYSYWGIPVLMAAAAKRPRRPIRFPEDLNLSEESNQDGVLEDRDNLDCVSKDLINQQGLTAQTVTSKTKLE